MVEKRRLAESPRFRAWVAEQHANWERGRTIEQEVAEMMTAENLLVEVRDADGQWTAEEIAH